MGMFDDVSLSMHCPKCSQFAMLHFQTKDLECNLYHYYPLDEDWFTREDDGISGRAFRAKLPVFEQVPYDKSVKCWVSQAEHTEIFAKPRKEIASKLKYIEIYGNCAKCKTGINGKLKIEGGYLMKPLYDIEIEGQDKL
jgi:hypothetical protein